MAHHKRPKGEAWRGFPARLRQARTKHGLSLRELARRSGVAQSLLSRLENDVRPWVAAETLLRLCETLRLRPEWLWNGEDPRDAGGGIATDATLDASAAGIDVAVSQASCAYHPSALAVARTFAARGERHTTAGWLARLDEIQGLLAPLLPR
jgi:transcriptional regulator with XRE-family HTH domain